MEKVSYAKKLLELLKNEDSDRKTTEDRVERYSRSHLVHRGEGQEFGVRERGVPATVVEILGRQNLPTRRSSEREPADSLRDKLNVIGGWLPSRTFALCAKSGCDD
jgi:hypothetical protein